MSAGTVRPDKGTLKLQSLLPPYTRGIAVPSSSETVPVAGPWVTDHEVQAVARAAATAWYDNANDVVNEFENAFAHYVGRRHAITLPTATSGLHLILLALGIGPGDEVVIPESTWIGSAVPTTYVGATPVFADVDPDTWAITQETLAAVVTERTRAVICVDLYGSMPDYDAITTWCAGRDIAVIEDSAESVGSVYKGRRSGSFGLASVFSFHGSKTLVTGEGGMVTTDDTALYDRMQVLRDHGRQPGDVSFLHKEIAYKYKMTSLQAAFGHAQLDRVDELVTHKRQIFEWYRERLAGVPGVQLNAEPDGVTNAMWMSTAVLNPMYRVDKVRAAERLAHAGIGTRPFFYPLSSLPAFADHPMAGRAIGERPVSHHLGTWGINLPSALCLEEAHVDYVCGVFKDILS